MPNIVASGKPIVKQNFWFFQFFHMPEAWATWVSKGDLMGHHEHYLQKTIWKSGKATTNVHKGIEQNGRLACQFFPSQRSDNPIRNE